MASKDPISSITETMRPMAFVQFGEVAATLQREILEGCEQLNRAWLARMQSEIALWSELASDLTSTPVFSRDLRNLQQMGFAADADGCGGWSASVQW